VPLPARAMAHARLSSPNQFGFLTDDRIAAPWRPQRLIGQVRIRL